MKKILFIACILFSVKASACLNIFAVDSAGRAHLLEHEFFFPIEFKQKAILKSIKTLERELSSGDANYKNISDYGAYLLMAGYFTEGLDIFRALSKKYPGVYEINANIAVAYELNGNIDSALYWEKAALQINPASHQHTEWIHLKILEARKKLQQDPDWCLKNNVTHILDSINKHYEFEQHEMNDGMFVFKDFLIQLNARFPFTYAEDKVMGKLMMELGDAYQVASIYRSYYCYAIAKYLYPALSATLDEKMRLIKMKYPSGTARLGKQTITLEQDARDRSDREMNLPSDPEVDQFINKLIERPALKNNKVKPVNIQDLIRKIQ
jgi:tetratricopeptide (TPR) repeat protein